MRVLPRPVAGALAGLLKLSRLIPANVDQLNIAVVNLRRLAQDLQYAACAGACLRDGRKLLRVCVMGDVKPLFRERNETSVPSEMVPVATAMSDPTMAQST
jgi:hypothetical protein